MHEGDTALLALHKTHCQHLHLPMNVAAMERLIYGFLLFAPQSHSLTLQEQSPIATNDSLKVPGDSPLVYCEDPQSYILDVDHIDISPNPPKA